MKYFVTLILCLAALSAMAQFPHEDPAEDAIRTTNFPKLKPLVMTDIPGAPILSQPQRIDGKQQEIRTVKHGLCYPALYDWNHDGLPDLLLGEFSTGEKENNIRVYLNEGTKKKSKFSGRYFYATEANGDTISNYQWCCIGIHPRFVDITGDGIPDLLSGQYYPGLVSLWRGSDKGFLQREYVPQYGYVEGGPENSLDFDSPLCHEYWNYTSAGFADYNGDGLIDMFVGGCGGLRVALNEGTKENPKFGLRQPLLFVDGTRLYTNPNVSVYRDFKTYITPVDWDGDGVLDLLITDNYTDPGSAVVSFYRGVKTNLGLRFEKPVPLFDTADHTKAMPGCQPQIAVGDLNGDGVNDLILGISIPTLWGYKADPEIAWKWISESHIQMPGKDSGLAFKTQADIDKFLEKTKDNPTMRDFYLGKNKSTDMLTLRHRGYVFVFYGKKNPVSAPAPKTIHVDPPKPRPTESFQGDQEAKVSYSVEYDKTLEPGLQVINVYVSFADGWHGYADLGDPDKQEFIPTTVKVELPEGYEPEGPISKPVVTGPVYLGQVCFRQYFRLPWKEDQSVKPGDKLPVKVTISYQTCNDQMCLPPEEHVIDKTFTVKD